MNEINPGRMLAAMRRTEEKTCALPGCNTKFAAFGRGKWCSESCKQRAKYRRKTAAEKDQS
jgi:hypothetical protein